MSGGVISGGHKIEASEIPEDVLEDLLDTTFERYFHSGALMGTKSSCRQLVWQLKDMDVDEIACLIDFGVDDEDVLQSLTHLDELRKMFSGEALANVTREAMSAFMEDLDE